MSNKKTSPDLCAFGKGEIQNERTLKTSKLSTDSLNQLHLISKGKQNIMKNLEVKKSDNERVLQASEVINIRTSEEVSNPVAAVLAFTVEELLASKPSGEIEVQVTQTKTEKFLLPNHPKNPNTINAVVIPNVVTRKASAKNVDAVTTFIKKEKLTMGGIDYTVCAIHDEFISAIRSDNQPIFFDAVTKLALQLIMLNMVDATTKKVTMSGWASNGQFNAKFKEVGKLFQAEISLHSKAKGFSIVKNSENHNKKMAKEMAEPMITIINTQTEKLAQAKEDKDKKNTRSRPSQITIVGMPITTKAKDSKGKERTEDKITGYCAKVTTTLTREEYKEAFGTQSQHDHKYPFRLKAEAEAIHNKKVEETVAK